MSNPPSPAEAKTILIEAAGEFYRKQWMVGTSGNLSIRTSPPKEPLQYVITASGHDKGNLRPNHFVLLGEGGTPLEETSEKSSAETMLHEAIYRHFSDVTAVYHIHTVAATVLSRQLLPGEAHMILSDLEMLKGLGRSTHETFVKLPVIENTQDINGLSQVVSDILSDDVPGLLLKGHGLYTWGKTPTEARRHVEIWEFLFQVMLAERLLMPLPGSAHKPQSTPTGF